MEKRGQVTIFIIIAILIIGSVALFFTLKGSLRKGTHYPPEVVPVVDFVQGCLDESVFDGIRRISLSGGYYNVPEPKKKFFPNDLPYYLYLGNVSIPSIDVVEFEFSKYIKDNLGSCLNGFASFKEYEIREGKLSVESTFSENKLLINLDYPLFIRKGNFSYQFTNLEKEVKTTFYNDYLLVEEIMNEQEKDTNSIPMGFISNLAYENNFTFDSLNVGDSDVVYFLVFNLNSSREFTYSFASKYNWEDLS